MRKVTTISRVARGAEGGCSPPHWQEKYAKYHVFSAFEAGFCSKNENSPPQWDWGAEVLKDLRLFGPEMWSFSGSHPTLVRKTDLSKDLFLVLFEDHLISSGKTVSILVETFFFGDHLILTEKPPQSDSTLIKIWVKFVYCCFQLPKKPPLPFCEFLAMRLTTMFCER